MFHCVMCSCKLKIITNFLIKQFKHDATIRFGTELFRRFIIFQSELIKLDQFYNKRDAPC